MIAPADVSVVVLAAGNSTRFGNADKLVQAVDGIAMIRRTVDTATGAGAGEVIVVTGGGGDAVHKAISGTSARTIQNHTPEAGMGTSLACGANAIRKGAGAILVMLGDMPFIRPATLSALFAAYDPDSGKDIMAPVHDGRRGHPVLFGKRHFPALWALTGDDGARHVLGANPERVKTVPVDDPGMHKDIDTPGDLARV